MRLQERYAGIIGWFSENMPEAGTELHYLTPYQLLVAVILSAQCTDKRVNLVTPDLFRAFPTVERMAGAEVDEVFEYVRSVSYPRSKSEHLVGMARRIRDEFGGRVPGTMDELLTLPGVGRKTANVILSIVFDRPAMAVDTHVFRVAGRIGLTRGSRSPLDTERQLTRHIPAPLLGRAHHWLILHGRYVCTARAPHCSACGVAPWCRSYGRIEGSK